MQIACRIHACAYPRKEKEREGRNQEKKTCESPPPNVEFGIRFLFPSLLPSFLFCSFFFLRDCDDVVSEMLAFEERIGAVGREKEFAKGEGGKFS